MALTESRRQQLDGIVQQMIDNGETDDDIQFVVNDFKGKYENEGIVQVEQQKPSKPLSKRVKDFAVNVGKDIARPFVTTAVTGLAALEGTGRVLGGDSQGANRVLEQGYNVPGFGQIKPVRISEPRRVVGTGAGIAATLAGGGGATNLAKQGAKGVVKEAALQAGKQGVFVGGLEGFGGSVQKDNASISNVLGNTLLGASIGGFAGTLAGPLATRATKAGRTNVAAQKALEKESKAVTKISEIVKPLLSPSEKVAAIERGRGIAPTLFKEADIAPDVFEKEVAKVASKVINPKKNYFENISMVRKEITDEADSLVKNLGKNNAIFNTKQLQSKLDSIETPVMVQSDQTLANAYKIAKDRFMIFANAEKKNLSGLLQARKKFDVWVEKNFPKMYEDEAMKPLQQALKDMRNAANDYIAEKLPDGTFRQSLRKQSLLFEALGNMSEKAAKEVGKTGLQGIFKKYPLAKDAIKYAAGGTVGATLLNKLGGD